MDGWMMDSNAHTRENNERHKIRSREPIKYYEIQSVSFIPKFHIMGSSTTPRRVMSMTGYIFIGSDPPSEGLFVVSLRSVWPPRPRLG